MQGEEEKSSIDVLMELLNKENPEIKTELEMSQIKIKVMARWYKNIKTMEAAEALDDALSYYDVVKMSYKRKREQQIIKGVTELSERFQQEQLMMKQQDKAVK